VLKGYQEEANRLYQQTGTAFSVGSQAILKLSLLAYYLTVYTDIIKSNFEQAYYVDLFAGCGLTQINTTGDIVLGSAMLASQVPKPERKFDKIFLIERNAQSASSLRQLLPNATIVPQDVNTVDLDVLLGESSGWSIPTLGFVDPEGMDPNWAVLEPLLKRWSDVMINYHPDAVRRAAGRSREESYARAMTEFFGTEDWRNVPRTDEAFLNLYVSQIHKYKDIVVAAKVRGQGGYFYHMIVVVKKTKGAQGWVSAIERAKKHIENSGPKLIETLLQVYAEKQDTMDSY